METWMLVVGAVVLVTVALGWQFWWKPKKECENHWSLFRARLVRGEDSVLAEMVRDETVTGLRERETFLRGILKSAREQRHMASSVADFQYDDVRVLSELVNSAEQDRKRAEDLQKMLLKKAETAQEKSEVNAETPSGDPAATGTND